MPEWKPESPEDNSSIGDNSRKLTRRKFVSDLVAAGSALLIGKTALELDRLDVKRLEGKRAPSVRIDLRENSEYEKTTVETLLMSLGLLLCDKASEKFGIKTGNEAVRLQDFLDKPKLEILENIFGTVIAGPVTEELLFRLFASVRFIDAADETKRWDIGLKSAAAFALIHNFYKNEEGEVSVSKRVPIQQFVEGVYFWYLMRERGVKQSVFAHNLTNATSLAFALLEKFPGKKEEVEVK